MDMFYRLVFSSLTVALLGNIITSDHPVRFDEVLLTHDVPKREVDCLTTPCANPNTDERGIPFVLSVALASVLILSGLVCMLWDSCLRKGRSRSDPRQSSCSRSIRSRTPPKTAPRASVNFDLDDIVVNDLYSSDSDEECMLEGPDFSMMESYNVEPVAACSPYHLAWTTPKGTKLVPKGEKTRENELCTCTVINECVDYNQNSKPECDQHVKRERTEIAEDAISISSSTPYRTPRVGYARGRPYPTPIERLASIRPGIGSPAMKVFTPGPTDYGITPKKLFLEKRRQSVPTPVKRLIDIQPRTSRSDDPHGSRMEDSLLWDSYPFRPSEESLVWDDDVMEKPPKMDENCNDPMFESREEGVFKVARSVAL